MYYNFPPSICQQKISAQIILKPDCVLGLATGSSPIGAYNQLVEWYEKGDLDFSQVSSVNLDEYRGLDKKTARSYHYFMHKHLFDRVNIDLDNTNVPNGMAQDADEECRRYEELVQSYGGVDLTESTIEANQRFFASADEVPRQAISMGIGTIMKAKNIPCFQFPYELS